MKLLYAIYYALLAIPYLFCACLPLALHALMTGELAFLALVLAPVWLTAPAVAYWIHAYYRSARFVLTADEIVVERGVWWRRKDIVPYNRITNLSVVQGPISRALGLATIRVQTAGFSTPSPPGYSVAEAELFHVEDAHRLAEEIMSTVRRLRPVAVEAAPELAPSLADLVREALAEFRG